MKLRAVTRVVTKASKEAGKDSTCSFCGFSVSNPKAHYRSVHGFKSNDEFKAVLADHNRLWKWRSENGYTDIIGQCGYCLKQCSKYTINRCIKKCEREMRERLKQ